LILVAFPIGLSYTLGYPRKKKTIMTDELGNVVIPTFDNSRNGRSMAIQIISISVVILAILGFIGYFVFTAPPQSDQRAITFRVEGSVGSARITYTEPDGHQTEATFVTVPWQPPLKMYRGGMQVFLTAGTAATSGTITCIMLLDGQEWKRDSTNASEGKVACGGIVP
jgi:hypothetical protein